MEEQKLIELKRQLAAEAAKENSDSSILIALTSEIAKYDKDSVRFSVDAGIINRLGKELVGRHETAVSELVKNAYDADAFEVNLTFENALQPGGRLIISDNGVGMTRSQLINGFMRLSSAEKIHNPISVKYKRSRAGKKGIGRFATQRLGKKLTIVSQTLESDSAVKVTVDWDRFEMDKDLTSISNNIELVPKLKPEGTDLIIDDLREAWSDSVIKRVYRYTSELLQPFPLSQTRKDREQNRVDPGFQSHYYRREGNDTQKIVDEEEAIFKHALAEIEGYILSNGQGCWALKSDKLGFAQEVFSLGKDRDDPESPFSYIRDVHFKCYYFIYEPSLFSPSTFTFIRDIANEKGGIRLYKNGFRVLPYGEKGNDWLGLDESTRRRVVIVPHQNISFFGFVEISNEPELFEETSSREGLIENDAFNELTEFVYRAITSAVLKVAELRGRKGTASQRNWKKDEETPTQKVDSAISEIKTIVADSDPSSNSDSDKGFDHERFDQAFKKLLEGRAQEREEAKKLIEELNMLRILAGLGLVIGEFVHEVKRFLPAFDSDTTYLKGFLKENPEGMRRIERLEINLKAFTAYTAYFDKAISQNVLRELKPLDLRDVINDFEDVILNDIKRSGIQFNPPIFNGFDLITIAMHPSEWSSILFNLYTNAKKAIKRNKLPGIIQLECGQNGDFLYLEFSDNGIGIPKENELLIFNAFFTTSSPAGHKSNENDSLTGTGLGLKIVKDIIESYGGQIFVAPPNNGFKTKLRIEIPINKAPNGEV